MAPGKKPGKKQLEELASKSLAFKWVLQQVRYTPSREVPTVMMIKCAGIPLPQAAEESAMAEPSVSPMGHATATALRLAQVRGAVDM